MWVNLTVSAVEVFLRIESLSFEFSLILNAKLSEFRSANGKCGHGCRPIVVTGRQKIADLQFSLTLPNWNKLNWNSTLSSHFCLSKSWNMFYNDVARITRCNKLHLLSDLVKCISAKLLEASTLADLLPTIFRLSSVNVCQPDFSLIQRPVKLTLSTFPVGGNRSTRRKPTTFGRALTDCP